MNSLFICADIIYTSSQGNHIRFVIPLFPPNISPLFHKPFDGVRDFRDAFVNNGLVGTREAQKQIVVGDAMEPEIIPFCTL